MDNPMLILVLNSVLMCYDLGTLAVLSLSKEVSTEREREGGRERVKPGGGGLVSGKGMISGYIYY